MQQYNKTLLKKNNYDYIGSSCHPYRILIIGGSWSGKTHALLSLTKWKGDDDYSVIHKIHLYVKD